jgi:hypothetical protein
MTINSPNLNLKNYTHAKVKLGSLYLFENFMITEFDEGVNINFENFSDAAELIKIHYKNEPFGLIANRINSYSLDLSDAHLANKTGLNIKAYAVVVYRSLSKSIFEIESHFLKFNRKAFNNVENAIAWTNSELSSTH